MLVLPPPDWHRDEDGAKARRAPALAGKTPSARTGSARPAWRRTTRPRARWRRRARPGAAGARQVESSLLIRAQRAAVMTSDPTQQASMTGKPPGEPLAPRTTDQNTHSGLAGIRVRGLVKIRHLAADPFFGAAALALVTVSRAGRAATPPRRLRSPGRPAPVSSRSSPCSGCAQRQNAAAITGRDG
jgi:hypothetical protein